MPCRSLKVVFHDRQERVAGAAEEDVAALKAAGMEVHSQRREAVLYQVLIRDRGESTKLEWVVDSDFRFYPTQRDPDFGYVLHPADLAPPPISSGWPLKPPVDGRPIRDGLRQCLDEADAFVRRMPTDKVGLLFLNDSQPVQPDPDHLEAYIAHPGARRGHWPSSADIGAAMLERYRKPPS